MADEEQTCINGHPLINYNKSRFKSSVCKLCKKESIKRSRAKIKKLDMENNLNWRMVGSGPMPI